MPVEKCCLSGTLSWRAFVLADCNREVKADVKSTLCHDQTPAIGINLCVYRMVCCVLENVSISSSLDASQQVSG